MQTNSPTLPKNGVGYPIGYQTRSGIGPDIHVAISKEAGGRAGISPEHLQIHSRHLPEKEEDAMPGINSVIKHFAEKDLTELDFELLQATRLVKALADQRDFAEEHKKLAAAEFALPAILLIDLQRILDTFGFENLDEITVMPNKRMTPWVRECRDRSKDLRRHIPHVVGLKRGCVQSHAAAAKSLIHPLEHLLEEKGEQVRCGIIPEREREVLKRVENLAVKNFDEGLGRNRSIERIEQRLALELRCEHALGSLRMWQCRVGEPLEPFQRLDALADEELTRLCWEHEHLALEIETRPTKKECA